MENSHVATCERYLDDRAACTCPLPDQITSEYELEKLRLQVRDKALDTTMMAIDMVSNFFKSLKK